MARITRADGIIIHTDHRCVINGEERPGIPILIWSDGIDEIASEWFGSLLINEGLEGSSVHEYANILRPFLRFCRREHVRWQDVDDDFLVRWRDKLISGNSVSPDRINACLQTIFQYYCWAQEVGYLKYHVGVYTDEELGDRVNDIKFRITARSVVKFDGDRRYLSWRPTVRTRGGVQLDAGRNTPTEEEKRRLWAVVINSVQGVRDSLILSWAEQTGARRSEILQVRKSQLPKRQEMASVLKKGLPWPIPVRRKGGKIGKLKAPPRLLRRMYTYIDIQRAAVVARCREQIVGYYEPDEVFISSRTGLPLHPDSVTTMGRRNFAKAGIPRANIHRLRADFAKILSRNL